MNGIARGAHEHVRDVQVSADTLTVALMDSRDISAPLARFLRPLNATRSPGVGWLRIRCPLAEV